MVGGTVQANGIYRSSNCACSKVFQPSVACTLQQLSASAIEHLSVGRCWQETAIKYDWLNSGTSARDTLRHAITRPSPLMSLYTFSGFQLFSLQCIPRYRLREWRQLDTFTLLQAELIVRSGNGSPSATNVVVLLLLGVVVSTKAFSFHNRSSSYFAHGLVTKLSTTAPCRIFKFSPIS